MKGWLMTHWHARPRAASPDEREQLVQEIAPLLRSREERRRVSGCVQRQDVE